MAACTHSSSSSYIPGMWVLTQRLAHFRIIEYLPRAAVLVCRLSVETRVEMNTRPRVKIVAKTDAGEHRCFFRTTPSLKLFRVTNGSQWRTQHLVSAQVEQRKRPGSSASGWNWKKTFTRLEAKSLTSRFFAWTIIKVPPSGAFLLERPPP